MHKAFNLTVQVIFTLTLCLFASQVEAWGSDPIPERRRPGLAWVSRFPSIPTITVGTGQSIAAAIANCNSLVGSSGFCTVAVQGDPSDDGLDVRRSRTKIVGRNDPQPVLRTQNADTFISMSKSGLQHVVIESLELQGRTKSELFGISVRGSNIRNVLIKDNYIHDFVSNGNAHGISVHGTAIRPVSKVSIMDNSIERMQTGSSESIVVNGNVNRWQIVGNFVHEVNNIAIDAIGGEGTLAGAVDKNGRLLPHRLDAARNGFIESNFVDTMSTVNNPQYGLEHTWAAGIYVDGGRSIKISGNTVKDAPWGIEIGAENCVTSRDVIITGNTVSGSRFGDAVFGGYAETGFRSVAGASINCDPTQTEDANEGHGYVDSVTATFNDFLSTGVLEDKILVQFRTTNTIIAHPEAPTENEDGDGSASGDANAVTDDVDA